MTGNPTTNITIGATMSARAGSKSRTRFAAPIATNIAEIAAAMRHPSRRWHRAHSAVYSATVIYEGLRSRQSGNDRDQRAAGVNIDLARNHATAAPLHPMVLQFSGVRRCETSSRHVPLICHTRCVHHGRHHLDYTIQTGSRRPRRLNHGHQFHLDSLSSGR
ncbi:hypothetical protein Poly51_61230 [Rubripirellula tenax]|uniref:Uncharacterized protein n=1 Tax=Rubripirellula tenax TaxID=2528015 RepID=A0A5C6E959_9BACT|nr:hypothetical protein Poly51_61230 [Rubripirellula tenax]